MVENTGKQVKNSINLFEDLDDLIFIESKIKGNNDEKEKKVEELNKIPDNNDNFMIDLGNSDNSNFNNNDTTTNKSNSNPFSPVIKDNKISEKENIQSIKNNVGNKDSEEVNKNNTNSQIDLKNDLNKIIRHSTPNVIINSVGGELAVGTSIIKSKSNSISLQGKSKAPTDLRNVIKSRLAKVNNDYVFTQNYSDNILSFFRKFNSIVLAKVEYSLDFNKKFMLFFKNISQCYFSFAKELQKSNELINIQNNQGMILSNYVNRMLEQTQSKITSYFENFSTILGSRMISSGIKESKIKEFYYRLNVISKDIDNSLNKIVKQKANLTKDYNDNKKVFEDFKQSINDNKAIDKLISKNDFFSIEYKLNNNYRVMNALTKDFLLCYKEKLLDLQVLILDYVALLKETIDTYITENRKIFNESGFIELDQKEYKKIQKENESKYKEKEKSKGNDEEKKKEDKKKDKEKDKEKDIGINDIKENLKKNNKDSKLQEQTKYLNFDELQKHYDSLNKDSIDEVFSTNQIINEKIDVDLEYLKALNEILGKYQQNLLISGISNLGNLEIKDFDKFKLEKYSNFNKFLDFLVLVNPFMSENLEDYLKYDFQVKRENGLILDKWQNCRIVVTIQNSIFIYDLTDYNENTQDIKIPKLIEKLNVDTIKFVEKDSEKNPFRFSLNDQKKGMIFNSKLNFEFDAENIEVFEAVKSAFS